MWKRVDEMCLAFLILLAYSFPSFSLECNSNPNCASTPTSNYTLTLDVSSHVVVWDKGFNYILAGEEVTLTATAHRNNNSSNFTDLTNQSQVYYYNFQCHNLTKRWYPINCSKESTVVEVWHHGGTVECSVQLLTQDNKTLACNLTRIKIAVVKDGFCEVDVNTLQENHNENKPAYAVGNVTFEANFSAGEPEYFLCYSFGDNTSATLKVQGYTHTTHIHNYTDVCNNCSYDVTVILLEFLTPRYCPVPHHPINVIKPVTSSNSDIIINSGKKLYKGHPATLMMTSDATPPFNVCWHLYEPAVRHNVSAQNCPLLNTGMECQTFNSTVVFDATLNFASTGSYMLMASFENNANCTVKNYTLLVNDPIPVTAEEVVGGVVGIIIACVIVFILIVTVLGYIQYRRYKNRHIETAKFNFVVLPPINTNSRWAQFKMGCRKRWYKFRGRRIKKGLVPMLDGSGRYTYSDSYSTTASYGALLQSEQESYKDLQVSVLHDYVSSGFHEDNSDNT